MKLTSINPSNNKILGELEITSDAEVAKIVQLAHGAKESWKDLGIEGRNVLLRKFYDLLEKHSDELARIQSEEMGMPLAEAKIDLEGSLEYLRWYSDHSSEYLAPFVTYETDTEIHRVYREPRGVVGSIIPWNFPMSNIVWQCGQNLVAGNVVVLKPSEEVPMFTKKFEELVMESALPKGVLSLVYGDGKVGDILAHSDIDMLCFTGSTKVGKYLYKVAAEKFIPALTELGGSAPGIVFEDVDINEVVDTIMMNRFINCGQACDGLKRLIVHESKMDEVIALIGKKIEDMILGDALISETTLGPLVAERQVKVLEDQVSDAIQKGAKVVVGGERPKNLEGAYYKPTLLTGIKNNMRVWTEEVFGPVLPVISFKTEEEAIALANDTPYGLGCYIFTNDKDLYKRVASRMQSGMVSQNNLTYLRPFDPFGGYKNSGIGREHGKYGFEDVTQVKVIATEK